MTDTRPLSQALSTTRDRGRAHQLSRPRAGLVSRHIFGISPTSHVHSVRQSGQMHPVFSEAHDT